MSRRQYKKFDEYGHSSQRKFRKIMESKITMSDCEGDELMNTSGEIFDTFCGVLPSERERGDDDQATLNQVCKMKNNSHEIFKPNALNAKKQIDF